MKSTRDLFPNWLTAEAMLWELWDKSKYGVFINRPDMNTLSYSFIKIAQVRNELDGQMVDMTESFPEEDRQKVLDIIKDTHAQYVTGFESKIVHDFFSPETIFRVCTMLEQAETHVIVKGGLSFRDQLAENLGLRAIIRTPVLYHTAVSAYYLPTTSR